MLCLDTSHRPLHLELFPILTALFHFPRLKEFRLSDHYFPHSPGPSAPGFHTELLHFMTASSLQLVYWSLLSPHPVWDSACEGGVDTGFS